MHKKSSLKTFASLIMVLPKLAATWNLNEQKTKLNVKSSSLNDELEFGYRNTQVFHFVMIITVFWNANFDKCEAGRRRDPKPQTQNQQWQKVGEKWFWVWNYTAKETQYLNDGACFSQESHDERSQQSLDHYLQPPRPTVITPGNRLATLAHLKKLISAGSMGS